MQTLDELASALEAARKAERLSYADLAKAAGLTPLATRRALAGKTAPRFTSLVALADRLGLEFVLVPKVVAEGLERTGGAAGQAPASAVEKLLAGTLGPGRP